MGLFDNKTSINKVVKDICNTDYIYSAGLMDYDFGKVIDIIGSDELICKYLKKLAEKQMNYEKIEVIADIYKSICIDSDNLESKNNANEIINLYIACPSIFECNNNFYKIVNSFNDKKMVLEIFKYLIFNDDIKSCNLNDIMVSLSLLFDYALEARQYFVDDRALLTSLISLISDIDFHIVDKGDVKNIIAKKLIDARKSNGIYDIDESTLQEIDRKANLIESASNELEDLIEISETQISLLQNSVEDAKNDIADARVKEVSELAKKSRQILKDFNKKYTELLSSQRESLIKEKDLILSTIDDEIAKKKVELESTLDFVAKQVAIELGRIRNVSNESMTKIQDYIKNDEDVKKLLADAKTNDEFLERLYKIEQISLSTGISTVPSSIISAVPNIIVPTSDRVLDTKVNYYFDKTIPFTSRFSQLMELKQKDIEENGAIYHEKFDHLLTLILENDVPYMYGPSGCGKTYIIQKQLANLLGINVVTSGYILYEQDVLGYTNSATGAYVPSNFYRCYKFGDMIFLDELDNGIANATVVLNSFIGGDEKDSYTFPDGIKVSRHPNFRIVAAGNTKGNGRTLSYNTRQKLDESVMQRLTPIEIDYDNRIEARILKNYPDWYEFCIKFREAIKEIPNGNSEGTNYEGTITTRDAETIRKYKDNNSFNDDDILQFQFIENKERDYLSQIETKMKNMNFEDEGAKKLFKRFKSLNKQSGTK